MRFLKLFIVGLPVAFLLDLVWIGAFAQNFYRSQIGFLLSERVNWPAAVLFYVFFVSALIMFVLEPALKARSLKTAVVLGAALGFTAYMSYDLTNLAITQDWPLAITLVDLAWGTALSTMVSAITYVVATKVFKY